MMGEQYVKPTADGWVGQWDTRLAEVRFEVDCACFEAEVCVKGKRIGVLTVSPKPKPRAPFKIPKGYDPKREKHGCCDPPTEL